eukprot:3439951-Alexandrium_andersonii.AAC.1
MFPPDTCPRESWFRRLSTTTARARHITGCSRPHRGATAPGTPVLAPPARAASPGYLPPPGTPRDWHL